jgi:4-amino-4-deoxy-L-arabinose transferase-like glycosyltransferase
MQSRPRSGALTMIVGLVAVMSLGLMAYALKTGAPLRYSDERQYVDIAMSLRNGHGFELNGQPTAYRPPAWPMLLAAFLTLGVPVSFLSVIPAAAMIAAAVVAAIVGVRISRSPWGALASVAVLAYPLNVYSSITLYPQAFATFLVLSLWLLLLLIADELAAQGRGSSLRYLLLGLAASLLALSVPTLAFIGLAVLVWMLFVVRGDRIRAASYALSGLLVPVALWTVRNILTFRAPVFLSTSTGVNLLIGNNPTATGSSGVAVDISGPQQTASTMSEVDSDAFLRNSAVQWITHHPVDSVVLYAAKVANYFSPYNAPVTASESSGTQRLIAYLSCAVLVLLVLARVFLRQRLPFVSTERLFLALFLVNAPLMAVFFTRTRFRQPLDNILVVEAAIAIAVIVNVIIATRKSRT